MKITPSELADYEKAQKKVFGTFPEPSSMAIVRWKLTKLSVEKYLYIRNHYNELRGKLK